jgi:hypothetical protein
MDLVNLRTWGLFLPFLLGCEPQKSGYLKPHQQEAWQIVSSAYGITVPPIVIWWEERCPGTEKTAVVYSGTCFSGFFQPKNSVHVAWRGSINESAYAHELMHYALYFAGLGADPDHRISERWELSNKTNQMLADLGF